MLVFGQRIKHRITEEHSLWVSLTILTQCAHFQLLNAKVFCLACWVLSGFQRLSPCESWEMWPNNRKRYEM